MRIKIRDILLTIVKCALTTEFEFFGPLIVALFDSVSLNRRFSKIESELTKEDKAKLEERISDYDSIIAQKSNYAEAHYKRGVARFLLEQYEAAIADFDEAIRLNPESAETYHVRGVAKNALNQHEISIIDYNKAILLNPDYGKAYYDSPEMLLEAL